MSNLWQQRCDDSFLFHLNRRLLKKKKKSERKGVHEASSPLARRESFLPHLLNPKRTHEQSIRYVSHFDQSGDEECSSMVPEDQAPPNEMEKQMKHGKTERNVSPLLLPLNRPKRDTLLSMLRLVVGTWTTCQYPRMPRQGEKWWKNALFLLCNTHHLETVLLRRMPHMHVMNVAFARIHPTDGEVRHPTVSETNQKSASLKNNLRNQPEKQSVCLPFRCLKQTQLSSLPFPQKTNDVCRWK